MKNIIRILLVLSMILAVTFALADGWHCDACGSDNQEKANFCPICGTARPQNWTCPDCGEVNENGYNFCPICGKARPVIIVQDVQSLITNLTGQVEDETFVWPTVETARVAVKLKSGGSSADDNFRRESYGGPSSKNYIGTGAFKPGKVKGAEAWLAEGDFVLVDLTYATAGRRLVYFRANGLSGSLKELPDTTLTAIEAVTTGKVAPLYGPGEEYAVYDKKEAYLARKTSVAALFAVNGYVYCEFAGTYGATRGWIPTDKIKPVLNKKGNTIPALLATDLGSLVQIRPTQVAQTENNDEDFVEEDEELDNAMYILPSPNIDPDDDNDDD